MKFVVLVLVCVSSMLAHFQTVMVEKSVLEQGDNPKVVLKYEFTHPFEQSLMRMEKPQDVGVFVEGVRHSLAEKMVAKKKDGMQYWEASYTVEEPAVYQFYVDPVPYFEPAEEKFIRHQTKTIVDAFGAGEGWDEPVGFKAEIIPLSRPYSLYAGNLFSGQVFYQGEPVPFAEVEIEFYNTKGLKAPNDTYVTQVTKADVNGVFHVALPKAGWWGFAALLEDDETLAYQGVEYPIELGAVLWLKTEEMR